MKNKGILKVLDCFLIVALIVFTGSFFMLRTFADENVENAAYTPTISVNLDNGTEVKLLSGPFLEVVENYKPNIVKSYITGEELYAPEKVKISWEAAEGVQYYTFHISFKQNMSDEQVCVTFNNSVELENLYVGETYYYRIFAIHEDKVVKSQLFSFRTANLPRTIWVDGISNTRDIGGYYSEDGKYRIKQGMVYRGAQVTDSTPAIKEVLIDKLGVKTELDLRGWGSACDSSVNYVNVNAPWYTHSAYGVQLNSNRAALLTEIRTFANEENYPIYVHCQAGRDRTGTIIFLINSLLGVSEKDLTMDYELTYLSKTGSKNANYDSYASMFQTFVSYMKNYGNGSLSENCEKFMLDIGITQSEINSIKSILREEVSDSVTVTLSESSPVILEETTSETNFVFPESVSKISVVEKTVPNFIVNATEFGDGTVVSGEWSDDAFDNCGRLVSGTHTYTLTAVDSLRNEKIKEIEVYVDNEYYGDKPIIDEKELTAYTLNFDLGIFEGSVAALPVSYGQAIFGLETPSQDGNKFLGWEIDGHIIEDGTIYSFAGNETAVARWETEEFTISYVLNGGINAPSNPINYNCYDETFVLVAPNAPVGYQFIGWYVSDIFTDENLITEIAKGSHENFTLYARFDLAIYSIKYNTNGGVNSDYNRRSYSIASPTFSLEDAQKDGREFEGWYLDEKFTGERITEIKNGSYGNIELYAKWSGEDESADSDETDSESDVKVSSGGCLAAAENKNPILSISLVAAAILIMFRRKSYKME